LLDRVLADMRGDFAASRRENPGRRSARVFQRLDAPTELLAIGEWDSQADYERLRASPAYATDTVAATPPARIEYLQRLRTFARMATAPLVYSCVTLEAPPEHARELEPHLLRDMSSAIEWSPGLISREIYRIGEAPGRVLIVHGWRSMDDLDAFRRDATAQHDGWLNERQVRITMFAGAMAAQYLRLDI